MWMNGSRSARSTPAKAAADREALALEALRRGRDRLHRALARHRPATAGILGRVRVSAVTAGMWASQTITCVYKGSQRNIDRDCSRCPARRHRRPLVSARRHPAASLLVVLPGLGRHAAPDDHPDREVQQPDQDGHLRRDERDGDRRRGRWPPGCSRRSGSSGRKPATAARGTGHGSWRSLGARPRARRPPRCRARTSATATPLSTWSPRSDEGKGRKEMNAR